MSAKGRFDGSSALTVRSFAVLLMVVLASCGGAAPSADGSADASTEAEPSAAGASEDALPSASSTPASSGTAMEAVPLGSPDGDSPLGYLEYLPPTYAADGEPSPLLVFLHGAGEAGDGSEDSLELVDDLGIPQVIAAGDWPQDRPFVVLAPQYGTAEADAECGIADDLAAFLEHAVAAYNVDQARGYLTGVSCGAIGMWDYLASHGGELVAAAVPISGHALWALEEAGCAPLAEVPVWAFHGAADDVVPVDFVEEQIGQIGACEGADAAAADLTVYPDTGHVEAIAPTYDLSAGHDIYSWMLEHTNDPGQ